MDERSAGRLRIVFKMVYKGLCVVSELEDADCVIVNVENSTPEKRLTEFHRSYPGKATIILSDEPVTMAGITCLTRPFKLPELLEALKSASASQLSNASATNNRAKKTAESLHNKTSKIKSKDSKKDKNKKNPSIYYQPSSFLQGKVTAAIEKAKQQNTSLFLRCWSHRWIVVSPSSGYLVENLKERQLSNLGLIKTGSDIVFREESFSEEQMAAMAETPTKEVKVVSIQKFIWDIAVRTSRGRIPEGTSIDSPYVLKQWPNLTRLAKVNNSMRISAFWLDQPQSINGVANELKIPIQDVFTYFSAASATGLIKKAKRREDKMFKPDAAKVASEKKGLFSAILRKLERFSSTDDTQIKRGE